MPSDNLWGDLPLTKQLRTPSTILREQAAILESETDGLLIGRVGRQTRGETFDLLFNIVAPSLRGCSRMRIRPVLPAAPVRNDRRITDWSKACPERTSRI